MITINHPWATYWRGSFSYTSSLDVGACDGWIINQSINQSITLFQATPIHTNRALLWSILVTVWIFFST